MLYLEHYPNGIVKIKGILIDDQKDGEWLEFFPDGRLKSKKYFRSGIKHGVFEFYKENGDLDFKLVYTQGRIKISNFKIL
jgi:uncharacterized protein